MFLAILVTKNELFKMLRSCALNCNMPYAYIYIYIYIYRCVSVRNSYDVCVCIYIYIYIYIEPNKFDLQLTEKSFFLRSSSAPLTSIWKLCEILTTSKERENQCFYPLEKGNWASLYWQCLGSCSILFVNSWYPGASLGVTENRQIFKIFFCL